MGEAVKGEALGSKLLKIKPPHEYPVEEGHYLRGNDYSPVALICLLDKPYGGIPPHLEKVVSSAIEGGAALAGTLQTENIGVEKIILNIVANPNIRYIIVAGSESEGRWEGEIGHLPGEALNALWKNSVDGRRKIVGTKTLTPYLYNIPLEAIDRFRKQILAIINLYSETDPVMLGLDPEVVKKAVWCCFQEKPTQFLNHTLYDPGAFPDPPLTFKMTWRISKPWIAVDAEVKRLVLNYLSEKRGEITIKECASALKTKTESIIAAIEELKREGAIEEV